MDYHPIQGVKEYSKSPHATETGMSASQMSHLDLIQAQHLPYGKQFQTPWNMMIAVYPLGFVIPGAARTFCQCTLKVRPFREKATHNYTTGYTLIKWVNFYG